MLILWPILIVRERSTHQCASDEHSRHDGGTGYYIGWVLTDSILAATMAAAIRHGEVVFFCRLRQKMRGGLRKFCTSVYIRR